MTTFLQCYLGGNGVVPTIMQYELDREMLEKIWKNSDIFYFIAMLGFKFHKSKI